MSGHVIPTLRLSFYLLPYCCMLSCIILSSISRALHTQYLYSVTIIFKHSFCNSSLHSGSPHDPLHLTSILYRGTFHVGTALHKYTSAGAYLSCFLVARKPPSTQKGEGLINAKHQMCAPCALAMCRNNNSGVRIRMYYTCIMCSSIARRQL